MVVAVRNGAMSFRDYYDNEHDPMTRDLLTQAYNRPTFERRRKSLSTYSLILLDIDNFKQINDTYGHQVGDKVLSGVGSALRLGSGDQVFRVGGEEFAVLLAGCSASDAARVAERLVERVARLDVLEGQPVTVSAGVAWSGDPASHEATYRHADRALYQAKLSGKNRVERYDVARSDMGRLRRVARPRSVTPRPRSQTAPQQPAYAPAVDSASA